MTGRGVLGLVSMTAAYGKSCVMVHIWQICLWWPRFVVPLSAKIGQMGSDRCINEVGKQGALGAVNGHVGWDGGLVWVSLSQIVMSSVYGMNPASLST